MPLATGDRLGRYEILALIGAGGMGEVYRATDSSLGREVALKTLPEEMSSNKDRLARFYREARSAAALNHPNIVTMYSVEESNGIHFLTMELVDGQPLSGLLRAGGLPSSRVVELATAMAEAVAAAHDKNVVHRDLKPANIMITRDGRVKVLDFGLAKELRLIGQDDETRTYLGETQAGTVMGTPAYMSPEQISGAAVDHRTDIFSLGVIAYEMLTGHRPFEGKSQMELAASILRDTPPPVSKPDAPKELLRLVEQCLVKRAADRMLSARGLASGLQAVKAESALSTRPATVGPRSSPVDEGFWVAVAPFRFSGAHGELSALSDGLTEEIIAGLSRFTYLRVLTKGTTGARYVLEGSLRQSGTQLRVAVKLIDTSTGANLWAENYSRAYSPDTIFDLQDDLVPTIVSTIAESTGGVLTHSMWIALRAREPASLTPYEAMIRSNGFYETLSHDEYVRAVALLKRVIEQEPNHSGCLAQLSRVYSNGHQIGWGEDENLLDVSLACAQRAIATEPSSSFAHGALAYVQYGRRDLAGFRNAAERALTLNPFDGVAMATIGHGFAYSGEWQRGCELIERAMKLNPRHPGWYWYPLVHNAYRLRDYERALDCALRVNLPEQFWTPAVLAMAHAQLGNHALASKAVRDLLALKPGFESCARQELQRWFFEPGYVEHVLDGWRKAGLKV